jgi:hypothetical protein
MREDKFKVKASIFCDRKGLLLVEFMKKSATINTEQYLQALEKLKRLIRMVWPNRKITQALVSQIVPL